MRIATSTILAFSFTLTTHSERTETSEDVPLLQASWIPPIPDSRDYRPSYSIKADFERKWHPMLLEDKDLALTHAQQEVLKGQFEHSVLLEDKDVLQAGWPRPYWYNVVPLDDGDFEREWRPLRMLLEDKDLALTHAQQEVLKGQFEHSVLLEDKDVLQAGRSRPSRGGGGGPPSLDEGHFERAYRNPRMLLEDKDLALTHAQQEVLKGQFEHSVLLEDKLDEGHFERAYRIPRMLLEDKDLALTHAQQEVLKGQVAHMLLEDKDVPSGGFRGNRNERIRNQRMRLLEDKDLALSEDAPLMQLS